jgi:AAA family ATP:ADP antiporter
MLERLKSFFGGSLQKEERKKFFLLSVIFGITIGVYWLLRPLKDGVFLTMVGTHYLPWVKLLSVVVVIPVVMIYSKLVDRFPRHVVLYILSVFYALLAIVFAIFILTPEIGLTNTVSDPSRVIGWAFYLYVETFGTIMAALFWAFVSDTTTPDAAKRGYSVIVMGAQMGAVCFPLVSKYIIHTAGTGYAILFGVAILCFLPLVVFYYMHHIGHSQMEGFKADERSPLEGKHAKAGFLEGLRLLLTKPYLLGIFVIVSFYEVINAILDYQFKALAKISYTGDALSGFLTNFAIVTNLIGLICVLAGIDRIGRTLGFGKTLVLLPLLVGVCVVSMSFYPFLIVAFGVMAIQKSFNYSLNQPVKEQLYIPTTKDTKYKAKAWIDMFGSRLSKGGASVINSTRGILGAEGFIVFSLLVSFGLIGIWVVAALFVGRVHAQALREDRVVC